MRVAQALETDGHEDAVLAGERDEVGDGAERDKIKQRAKIELRRAGQAEVAGAFDERVGELEGEAGGAEFAKVRSSALGRFRCRRRTA